MKAQSTLEFIGSFLFFIAVLGSVITITLSDIPQFNTYAETTEKNLEVRKVTDLLLTSPGYHSNGTGGTDWENYMKDVEQPGLASDYLEIDRSKLNVLNTVDPSAYNYGNFTSDIDTSYDYNFNFTWYPIVETHRTFTRENPPSDPDIQEPQTTFYENAENRVHYGEITLEGGTRRFLVTAYDGDYNTTYVTDFEWDFQGRTPRSTGDTIDIGGTEFVIQDIQNRDDRPGTALTLQTHLKEFGRNPQTAEGSRVKLNRYAILDDPSSSEEIVKVEVLAW